MNDEQHTQSKDAAVWKKWYLTQSKPTAEEFARKDLVFLTTLLNLCFREDNCLGFFYISSLYEQNSKTQRMGSAKFTGR